MNESFAGKTALVTGGCFGIGRSAAIAFAARGARVVVADWIEDEKQETLNAIHSAEGEAIFVRCNVAEEKDVIALIETITTTYGQIDFAFNNAGIEGETDNTQECTVANWDKTIDINLKGVWLCMKYEIPQMLKQGKGAIVNCASVAGIIGFANLPAYVASKHGVVGLTKTAALENARRGIRINAVCPGVIKTQMIDRVTKKDAAMEKVFIDMEPVGRMGQPGEVAEAVIWLCSDAASFITGDAVPVDGGWLAG